MTTKLRLDLLLVERGLADSRAQAQALIRAGKVLVDGQRLDKPGSEVAQAADVTVRAPPPYVGRGGVKLAAALDAFAVAPAGQVCLDVGASTGGFTDVLLQRGAAHVYAVDVGRGQLAWKLRQDPRVTCLERTDIRVLPGLPQRPTLATIDVAFISLKLVLPAVAELISPDGDVIALVKPQFEAGRAAVGRGGVVRDPAVHAAVLQAITDWAEDAGWDVRATTPSPITGADGNREWFMWLRRATPPQRADGDAGAAPPRRAR